MRSLALADRVAELVRRVADLRPNYQRPEQFFEDRSEIETEAKRIERELRS